MTSFTADLGTPHRAQEETYLDPSEPTSYPMAEERLEAEAIEIHEVVPDVVEPVIPVATHEANLGNLAINFPILILMIFLPVPDAKALPLPVVMDQDGVEDISLSILGTSDIETSEGSSSGLSQHLSYVFGVLPHKLDHTLPTSSDEEQAASYLSSPIKPELKPTHHAAAGSPTDTTGEQLHSPILKVKTDDIAANSAEGDPDACVISIADNELRVNVSPEELLMDTQQPSAGILYECLISAQEPEMAGRCSSSPAEEPHLISHAPTMTNDLPMSYTALDPSSIVETLRSDMYVTIPETTNPVVVEHSEEFTLSKESSVGKDATDTISGPHNDVGPTPTDADATDQLPALAPVLCQAEILVELDAISKVLGECQTAEARINPANRTPTNNHPVLLDPSCPAEMTLASTIEVTNDCATSGPEYVRFEHEGYGSTTDKLVHDLVSPSSAYPLSQGMPSGSYPLRMVTRKATDPALFVDPYPYSLSTPGQTRDDASDEETEQENSLSSSSTFDKYSDDKVKESDIVTAPNGSARRQDDTELHSPSEPVEVDGPETADAMQSTESIQGGVPERHDVDGDTDADGDVDPEFIEVDLTPPPTHRPSIKDFSVVEDPFRVTGNKSPTDQSKDKDVQSGGANNRDELAAEQQNR